MSLVVLLGAILAAPPAASKTDEHLPAVVADLEEQTPLQPHEIRQALRATLRDEALSDTPELRHKAIFRLCALYAEMMLNEDFAEVERDKWRAKLASRLRSVRADLEKAPPPVASTGETKTPSSDGTPGAPGGGAVDARGARQLIDLITTTIDPETWDVQGGQGSIFYFNNFRVLVVRQTQEVHEKLGGVLQGVR